MRTTSRSVCLVIVSMLVPHSLAPVAGRADDFNPRQEFERHLFENSKGETLPYRLLKPAVIQPGEKYPLVIFLHGVGERGDDNEAQLVHGAHEFATPDNRSRFPCFVVAPQCPGDRYWSDLMQLLASKYVPVPPAEEPYEPLQRVIELLDTLPETHPIDPSRVYITGISMGGFGTWDLIQRRPELFAAAAPVCGGGRPQFADKLTHLPIWTFHGSSDGLISPDYSREMVQAIQKAGGQPLYTEYPGIDHDSWTITYRNPMFMSWLFAQRRGDERVGTR